jgi:hypothetical protein
MLHHWARRQPTDERATASPFSSSRRDGAFWHDSDLPRCQRYSRYRGEPDLQQNPWKAPQDQDRRSVSVLETSNVVSASTAKVLNAASATFLGRCWYRGISRCGALADGAATKVPALETHLTPGMLSQTDAHRDAAENG